MTPNSINLRFDRIAQAAASSLIMHWPGRSRRLAYALIEKYGTPHEATPSMLIWHYNGPWKRTVVHRDGVNHNVPYSHIDILEQTVDTRIRPSLASEVIQFDGSVLIDRTRGEMTAYCENEHANIFLLNLAHDIILGRKTAKEARKILVDTSDFFHSILPNLYRDSLQFTSTVEASDPDMVTAEPN